MTESLDLPVVGGDKNQWGAKLNAAMQLAVATAVGAPAAATTAALAAVAPEVAAAELAASQAAEARDTALLAASSLPTVFGIDDDGVPYFDLEGVPDGYYIALDTDGTPSITRGA